MWSLFGVVVFGLLALDLFMFHGKKRPLGASEALLWSAVWIVAALLFNGLVYFQLGTERGLEFLTGYLIEKALAVDNLVVFALIFSYLGIPRPANIACCCLASWVHWYSVQLLLRPERRFWHISIGWHISSGLSLGSLD